MNEAVEAEAVSAPSGARTGRIDAAREAREHPEIETSQHRPETRGAAGASSDAAVEAEAEPVLALRPEPVEFRVDLERIRFSSYFARLSAVTQVVPQSGVGPVMHNRLTHSLKVSAVARVIAGRLAGQQARHEAHVAGAAVADDPTGAVIARLGGCDTIVAQAAAHAHDLGHPPFGHLGERVLDRVARERLGLPEGFEGNAQTFRILTRLDTLGRDFSGLNLTAAVRAAVLKYPWTRARWIGVTAEELPLDERPRGVGGDPVNGAEKFSAYGMDAPEMESALAAFPAIAPGLQTIECSVMDLADDIAYAIHDLDDFARAGVLQQAAVSGEFRAWLAESEDLARVSSTELRAEWRRPGNSLELLWRRLTRKDDWIAERETFRDAVVRVGSELRDELLAAPYDGGIESERAVSRFTRRWIEHLRSSIVVEEFPHLRGGHIRLEQAAWHEVAILKFVHQRFVLERPEHALAQRGMGRVVSDLVLGFDEWLDDHEIADRAPRRLIEWVDESTESLFELRAQRPELLTGDTSDAGLRRQGRSRAVLDYVSSFTDQQAAATHDSMTGAGPAIA
ncbi:deoxyguanosinetriphosphate triphosphohydrolase family protein [Leucobacter sp. HNU]|uniref:deoxyguanosinetriphosphate triphosphohydrolase family protein n=1 Tax=Leucobacter sp. HNU TaxID=3236805 RepID=UPI003A7FC255